MRLNPRRLWMQDTSFQGYRAIINGMERATQQLASITRGFTDASNQESTKDQEGFVHA